MAAENQELWGKWALRASGAGGSDKPVNEPPTPPRDSRRVPLAHRIQLKFDRFTGFINEYVGNISPGGIFIRTDKPEPQGQLLDFEFRLGDGYELIRGRGEVVWARTGDEGPNRPPGMGVRFLELSPGSRELIYKIVDEFVQHGGTPFDVSLPAAAAPPTIDSPPRAAAPAPPGPPATSAALPPTQPSATAAGGGLHAAGPGRDAGTPEAAVDPLVAMAAALPPLEDLEPTPRPSQRPLFAAFQPGTERRRSRLPLIGLILALVVLAGAVYLMRDTLLGWVTGSAESASAARPHPIVVPGARPRLRALIASAGGTASEPAARPPSTALPGTRQPATPASPPPAGAGISSARSSGVPLSWLERITWEPARGGGTDVILWGHGSFRHGSYSHLRIAGPAAREVIRLNGIERPFSAPRLAVGTPELVQVRTGFHPIQQLHVVLDLTGPAIVLDDLHAEGNQLRLHLKRR